MKIEAQGESAGLPESGVKHPFGEGSVFVTASRPQSLDIERSSSSAHSNSKALGPRTRQGKQKSSRNATKHGVLSKVIVLSSESKAEYEELLAGLRETLQPEGALEELLVEKLATTVWRHRRLLLAESAEIRKNTEFVESDQRKQEQEAAETVCSLAPLNRCGLMRAIATPRVFECCLRFLGDLHRGIQKFGFRPKQDAILLQAIYGTRDRVRLGLDLYDSYEIWLQIAETSEQERERKEYMSPAECRMIFSEEIDKEVRRIKRDQKARASIETARMQLEIVCRNVPDGPGLDRLLRYEASLERTLDRTLSQLERLQRMRRGQPVLPKLEVRHSVS